MTEFVIGMVMQAFVSAVFTAIVFRFLEKGK